MHEHINDVRVAMVMARILFIATKWAKVTKSSQCVVTPMTGRDTGHMTLTHSSVPHHHALDGLHGGAHALAAALPLSHSVKRRRQEIIAVYLLNGLNDKACRYCVFLQTIY